MSLSRFLSPNDAVLFYLSPGHVETREATSQGADSHYLTVGWLKWLNTTRLYLIGYRGMYCSRENLRLAR